MIRDVTYEVDELPDGPIDSARLEFQRNRISLHPAQYFTELGKKAAVSGKMEKLSSTFLRRLRLIRSIPIRTTSEPICSSFRDRLQTDLMLVVLLRIWHRDGSTIENRCGWRNKSWLDDIQPKCFPHWPFWMTARSLRLSGSKWPVRLWAWLHDVHRCSFDSVEVWLEPTCLVMRKSLSETDWLVPNHLTLKHDFALNSRAQHRHHTNGLNF